MRICLRDCKYSKYASKILMGLPEHLFPLGSIMSRSPSVVWISCNFLQKLTGPSFNATLDLFIVPEDQPESSRRPKNPFISNCANKRGRGEVSLYMILWPLNSSTESLFGFRSLSGSKPPSWTCTPTWPTTPPLQKTGRRPPSWTWYTVIRFRNRWQLLIR